MAKTVQREIRECSICGKQGPIAEDETDPEPDDDDLILDSLGLLDRNAYVCGACLYEAWNECPSENGK